VLSSEPLAGADGYFLDVIEFADGRPMVRLRREVGAGPNEIAALMPTILFLPQISTRVARSAPMPTSPLALALRLAKSASV
jgi:hypothetical protein